MDGQAVTIVLHMTTTIEVFSRLIISDENVRYVMGINLLRKSDETRPEAHLERFLDVNCLSYEQ